MLAKTASAIVMSTAAWRPTGEVEMIVGTPPGGGQDRPARALMRVLESEHLIAAPMRLTNLPGKGGGNAWDALRARTGDPHVLSISSAPLITNKLLGVSDYDHSDLTPIATLYSEYLAFVARPHSRVHHGEEFLDHLKRDPEGLAVAIATAVGTTNHIALGQVARHAGADPRRLKLRVFESAPYAVNDVVEGHADVGVVSAASAVQAIHAGVLHAFAVSAPERMSAAFAGVPTWMEQSVPCTLGLWRGLIAAPGIEAAAIAFWEETFAAAVKSAVWAAELAQQYWTETWMPSAQCREFMDAERLFLGGMLADLGLMPE